MSIPDESEITKHESLQLAQRELEATEPIKRKGHVRRIAFATAMGALIESYDFGIYGFAAAFVFPKTFFPSLGPSAGLIASFATLGVAFVTRPLGAVIFGYFGDRYGRKKILVATVLGMGLSTAFMGMVPSADMIGAAAPIIVVLLRALQGIAFGGEWGGAQLFATEHAPADRRGLYGVFPQIGNGLANVLGPLTLLVVSVTLGLGAFTSWAWRIPFLASFVLVTVALYIRLKVEETPIFEKARNRNAPARVPLFDTFKNQTSTVLRAGGAILTTFAFYFIVQTYLPSYGVQKLALSQNEVFGVTALAGVVYTAAACVSSLLSDKFGRRRVIGSAQLFGVVWAIALFPIINLGTISAFGVTLCITTMVAGTALGAVGVLVPEQFPTAYRYTATSMSYQLAAILGGGVIPIIAPMITGSPAGPVGFGIVLAVISGVAALCTFSLKEKANESMDWSLDR
ncbi:MFS transporter [Arthrobacter bambusae]|uniref:MFS transporter n=1 Tax=Arthrobacter bambusae TaxID=1338426 RepID=UPI002784F7EF|nr:MFS transporter [Arthrobacter bambusae]MDQ0029092.1 MFS family permease [Arthrobacter bambusae]MDQ0098506.1 MFS family permease [Arthrobacter bambusae]